MLFFYVLLANILTAAIWRIFIHRGRFDIIGGVTYFPGYTNCAIIAGFKNQPENAFKLISLKSKNDLRNIIYVRYSNYGFNPKAAGKELTYDWCARIDEILAISLGAKAVAYSKTNARIIGINPCLSPDTLQLEPKKWFRRQAVLLEILSFLFGWLSFLPILKFEAGKYSLALYADQAFWVLYGNPTDHKGMRIILGKREDVLDNDAIRSFSPKSNFVEIDTGHATLDNPRDAKLYEQTIHNLL